MRDEKNVSSKTVKDYPQVSSLKFWLSWLLTLGIPVIITQLPTTPVYTAKILNFTAISTWALLSWIFGVIPEMVVGFILPVLYIVFGVATIQDAFSPWLGTVPWVCIGGIILSQAMFSTGLAQRIAYWAIIVTGGTYKRTLAGLMLAGLIMAPLVPSLMGKAAIFAVVGTAICKSLNLEPKSRTASGIMMGAFLAIAGPKLSWLTGTADNLLAMGLVAKVTGTMVTWAEYALHNSIIGILYSILALLVLYAIIKPEKEFDSLEVIETRYRELGPLTANEKKTLMLLGAALIMLMLDFLHKVEIAWILMIMGAVLFIPRIGVLKNEDFNKLSFGLIFFVTGAMSIGAVAAKIGAVKMMAGWLIPLMKGSTFHTFIATYFFGVVLKTVLTPLAAISMFMGTVTQIALDLGIHPFLLAYVFKYGVDQYVFPFEYAVLLYFYSFGYMTLGSVVKVMSVRVVVTAFFLALVAYPYWKYVCGL